VSARIYVVATPLGNREDLSPRAKRILQEADLIACEDTRRTGQLLNSMEIPHANLLSYFDANEMQRAKELIERIENSQLTLALVSDAGTPAIADPGFRLIKLAHEHKIPVLPVPGPSTLSALISVSGLPSDRVLFVGFLPRKKNSLLDEIQIWKKTRATILAFETPNRLCETLAVFAESLPNAQICIGRELTKIYEEVHLFSIAEAQKWAEEHTHLKGELAMMIDPALSEEESVEEEWGPLLQKAKFLKERGLSAKDLVEFFSDQVSDKKELYRRMAQLK
jgi:16S rRNA (cytidine1402-2'-O)-methyltransferase